MEKRFMIDEKDFELISRLIISGINLIVEGDCEPLTLTVPCCTAPDKNGFSELRTADITLTTKTDCFNCPYIISIGICGEERDLRITSVDGELLWDSKRPMTDEVVGIVEEVFKN